MTKSTNLQKMGKPLDRIGKNCRDRTQAHGANLGHRGTLPNEVNVDRTSSVQTRGRRRR